jgi:negative regulator of sigma E activity
MDKEQIKDLNEQFSDELSSFTVNISTDWEVDTAGNTYRTGDRFRGNLTDQNEGFKEGE